MPRFAARMLVLGAAAALAASMGTGCSRNAHVPRSCTWIIGRPEPHFDPDGPPDPARWALERMLTRGLMDEDSTGKIVLSAAERLGMSNDRLVYTFHLRPDLHFTDNTACRSADFQKALVAGLGRTDHATRDWLLQAVQGVDQIRAGKPLPPLGIEAPNDSTLVIRLARPDPLLLRKLALPGVSDPWKDRAPNGWRKAWGIGPYRPIHADSGRRLVLLKADNVTATSAPGGPDTVHVRFVVGASRVRAALRHPGVGLAWPLPPGLLDEPLPAGYRTLARDARPARRLMLVMRADLPPTSRYPTRHALAHGLNRPVLLDELRASREPAVWLAGAPPFDYPKLDGGEVLRWMAAGKLGRSFHVDMAYDVDGAGGEIARIMQGEWARLAIYVEPLALRGAAVQNELLKGRAHLLLVETQGLLNNPIADLAMLVMPLRGPAVGSFRTGWRTREMDPWISPGKVAVPVDSFAADGGMTRVGSTPFPAADLQRRLEDDRVAVPLADLPWIWVEPAAGPGGAFHPHFGPECSVSGLSEKNH